MNDDALAACRGYDALLYNVPLSISGHTIAEALGIPGIPTSAAPYHPTRAFPVPHHSLAFRCRAESSNRLSGAAAIQILWHIFRSHMNQWRGSAARPCRPLPIRNPLR